MEIPALIRLAVALTTISLICVNAASGQLTSGNLFVYRVGDGSGTLTTTSASSFIDQFNTTTASQTPINTVAIDNSGANRLTNSGSATSEGFLTRSTNGLLLNFGGYDADAGTG